MTNTQRKTYLYLFLASFLVLVGSFILQFGFKLEPCSLCIIARVLVAALTLVFLLACLHNPKKVGQIIYGLLGFLITVAGIAVTARHLWIIHLPPSQAPECGPGLNYLIESMPLKEALVVVLTSSGECAKNVPYFLGLSLPLWTMVAFVLLAIGCWLPVACNTKQR